MDSSLGNGDSLLLHDLMDCHSINVVHFIELIDADYTPISKNHGTSLKSLLACLSLRDYSRSQTHTTGPAACRAYAQIHSREHPSENLTLGCSGVSYHEDVDISSEMGSIL